MFDMLSGQYKNLASKGRYGDTMLAHINPEEAALLKSMGGAGTVNPQTGLREFYGMSSINFAQFPALEPLPTLGQALAPEKVADIPAKLEMVTPPAQSYRGQSAAITPATPQVAPEYLQYADRGVATGMGSGRQIEGYTVPTDKTFADIPLVAQYDAQGNFKQLTLEPGQYLYPDPSQPNIVSAPRINAKGEIIDYGIGDLDAFNSGGGLSGFVQDFAPMIALGLGANAIAGNLGTLGAAGASSGTGLSLGGSGLGLTGTAGTGLNLAATTGGGLGLTAGSAGAGAIGAGLGTALGAINTGIGSGAGIGTGLTTGGVTGGGTGITTGGTGTGVDYGITTGGTGTGTGLTTGGGFPDLSSLGSAGSAILDFAKANPSIAGSLLGAVTAAVGSANAPKSTTTTSSIDPQIKAEYLANLERAKATAAGLEARQIAQPGAMYTGAEQQLYNLGMTPFGATDIARFYNPFQEQVVQGALGDIERTRQMQEQANMEQATRARAFGGSRQGVVSGMTNEAAIRQAATTGAQLRSAGFTQAANLGLAARPLDIAGLQTSLGLGTTRTALEQARLDALRNLGTERLGITSGALGLQPANVGGTTSQPLYSNTAGNLLSGGLTGAYIGSLLKG